MRDILARFTYRTVLPVAHRLCLISPISASQDLALGTSARPKSHRLASVIGQFRGRTSASDDGGATYGQMLDDS